MCALEDMAAKLNMDPIEFFSKNADLAAGGRGKIYREELQKAAELSDWQKNWHSRGDKTPGHIKRGLGVSMHTWGGGGHNSTCLVSIHPDGSVETTLGSQDLGTGTRTVIAVVAAETLGLPVGAITVNIGDSKFPTSGPSGGSTTIGGVSASTRRASVDALDQLFAIVAPALGVPADQLVAVGGNIQAKGDASKKSLLEGSLRQASGEDHSGHGEESRSASASWEIAAWVACRSPTSPWIRKPDW
jgi:xanthine dehydrogenase YagR molybdenum-binding subunit